METRFRHPSEDTELGASMEQVKGRKKGKERSHA
jgi:hypothetical protein